MKDGDTASARLLAEWLKTLGPHILDARPVLVTIGNATLPAARYVQRVQPPPLAPNQATHDETRFYVLGDVPKVAQRPGKACFPFAGGEWFVAGGWCNWLLRLWHRETESDPADIRHRNPFGPWFAVALWDVPSGQKIDYFERKPYRRVPMAVETL
jgi:hypothetical protein